MLYENILYGKLDATNEEVKEAAKNANASDFIERLTLGYETEINEDGGNLSVGQRQLLNISRVFLNQPKILILDDSLSAVDNNISREIRQSLKEINATTIIISHNLMNVMDADNIVVLDKGKIVEQGTHNLLLKKKGQYSKIWSLQQKLEEVTTNE